MVKRILLAVLLVLFACSSSPANAETIGSLFKDKSVVKVFVKEVSNNIEKSQAKIEAFKTVLEMSLLKRKAITYKIVGTPAESDIQITASIAKFQYLVRGPLKPSLGIETTLLDVAATATQNYVEMAVDFTVIDTKTGNVLWKGSVEEYKKRVMTPEESLPLISDNVCRKFIWLCFGKANSRPRPGAIL